MDGLEFYDRIESHPDLEALHLEMGKPGSRPEDSYVIIRNVKTDAKFKVTLPAILEYDWGKLESVLTGARLPQVLKHMTRIVGYFSLVENWNRSKHGELMDRRAGDYRVGRKVAESEPVQAT